MIEQVAAAAEKAGEAIEKAAEKIAEATADVAKESAEMAEHISSSIEIQVKSLETLGETTDMEVVKNRTLDSIKIETGEESFPQPEKAPMEYPIEDMPELPPKPIIVPDFPVPGDIPEVNFSAVDKELTQELAEGAREATEAKEKIGLTDEEKALIKNETGWSDEIIDHIESMDQYEIYKNAGLHEAEVNGRKCLLKDIDMDYVDPKTGLTNRELMERGRPPIDSKTGERIELHHMGQDYDSPFAELAENSEHGDGNDGILHDKKAESWRNDPTLKNRYNNIDRPNHWKARAQEG